MPLTRDSKSKYSILAPYTFTNSLTQYPSWCYPYLHTHLLTSLGRPTFPSRIMSPDDVVLPTPTAHSLPAEIVEIVFSPTLSYMTASTLTHYASIPTLISTSTMNLTSGGESRPGAENGECKLLGPFALFIQGALGILALLVLVFKRWRERPQRPLKIWAFDASKQVVGSALLHVANLLMSMLSSGQLTIKAGDYQANPCSFYLLNLAIDVSFIPSLHEIMYTMA